MEEIWSQGESTVRLVMESLNRRAEHPRAYTTYMTVMRRLADKGLLDRTRAGRHDAYVAHFTRDEYRRRRADTEVNGLIDEFGDVALAQFAKRLSTLDPAHRRQLRRLAEEQ